MKFLTNYGINYSAIAVGEQLLINNKIYNIHDKLPIEKAAKIIYCVKSSGLLSEFMRRYPDHKCFIPFKNIVHSVSANSIPPGNATKVLFEKDDSRSYPSLGSWLASRGYNEPLATHSKNYDYVSI